MTISEALLSPPYVRKQVIRLKPVSLERPRAFEPVELELELIDEAVTFGVSLPVEFTITAPSPVHFQRFEFNRLLPSSVLWIPQEGGPHLVRLQELEHNLFWGSYTVDVLGDRLERQ